MYLCIYLFTHLLIIFLKIMFNVITEYLLMITEIGLFIKLFVLRCYNAFSIVSKSVRWILSCNMQLDFPLCSLQIFFLPRKTGFKSAFGKCRKTNSRNTVRILLIIPHVCDGLIRWDFLLQK
jgi:hypothetical protein